jgi:hypothetical protein
LVSLGGREAGVLADGPRLLREHRRVGAAEEGRDAGQVASVGDVGVGGRVHDAVGDAFGREPRFGLAGGACHCAVLAFGNSAKPYGSLVKSGFIGRAQSTRVVVIRVTVAGSGALRGVVGVPRSTVVWFESWGQALSGR